VIFNRFIEFWEKHHTGYTSDLVVYSLTGSAA